MGDKLTPLPVERLLGWILADENDNRIFGLHRDLFHVPRQDDVFRMERYGRILETPIGVAAGPGTQLSQNIIISWLCGARYLELKTVQTLDRIEVAKPCIDMRDEGYNCEWSQELTLTESYNEYLNAWIIIHLLRHKLGWGSPDDPGFIFNMSVGYDLAGIMRPNVQQFLNSMENCRADLKLKIESLRPLYPAIDEINIPSRISDNVTLSTMHGCPPDEIERIGRYLMEERKLHTAIKLNPTLLGPEKLRSILNDRLGYEVQAPDEAFEHDPKFEQAVDMIDSLRQVAEASGVRFGLKLTNTLETVNPGHDLPADEKMVYLSGRALHPISINVAGQLQSHFEGALDLSFCAGVDCFNAADTLACNLKPLTTCSDLLKPGGYTRLGQYLVEIDQRIRSAGAGNIDEYIIASAGGGSDVQAAGWHNLQAYAQSVLENDVYHKAHFPYESIKTGRTLTEFDCVSAPCMVNCAITQNIPEYMYHTADGDFAQAYAAILDANPLPNTTGMVCDHLCQYKCTRLNYDRPLLIREIKRFLAEHATGGHRIPAAPPNGLRVSIIGAGPSGLACAYFLARDGFEVHVYDTQPFAGGMPAAAIPAFRLTDEAINDDMDIIRSLGVQIHLAHTVDRDHFEVLRKESDYIYLGVGAQRAKRLGIPGEDGPGVTDQLAFLTATRQGKQINLGQRVAVIGGGNSAVDATRTALRLVAPGGEVVVLYRRTRREMPADDAEIAALIDEGAVLHELVAPEALIRQDNTLQAIVCSRMQLGQPDSNGRPRPVKLENTEFELAVDHIILAIGQETVLDFLPEPALRVDPRTGETQFPGIFAGGDVVRGADSLINAMGDGKRAAEQIIKQAGQATVSPRPNNRRQLPPHEFQQMQSRRRFGPPMPELELDRRGGFDLVNMTLSPDDARAEAARCLLCDEVCDICVTVCPNRANLAFEVEPVELVIPTISRTEDGYALNGGASFRIEQSSQIMNIDDFCNECGDCTTFCPTAGAPFRDKPNFFLSAETLGRESNGYHIDGHVLKARRNNRWESLTQNDGELVYETEQVRVTLSNETFGVKDVRFHSDDIGEIDLQHAARMYVLLRSLREHGLLSAPEPSDTG